MNDTPYTDENEDAGASEGSGASDPMGPGADKLHPMFRDLRKSMERLDGLLAEAQDEEKIRAGMGIRLAVGMGHELKQGLPFGTETGDLVAGWMEKYGQESVEAAIAIAREFLMKPEEMKKSLGSRLGLEKSE